MPVIMDFDGGLRLWRRPREREVLALMKYIPEYFEDWTTCQDFEWAVTLACYKRGEPAVTKYQQQAFILVFEDVKAWKRAEYIMQGQIFEAHVLFPDNTPPLKYPMSLFPDAEINNSKQKIRGKSC